jgi:hypothetical protein
MNRESQSVRELVCDALKSVFDLTHGLKRTPYGAFLLDWAGLNFIFPSLPIMSLYSGLNLTRRLAAAWTVSFFVNSEFLAVESPQPELRPVSNNSAIAARYERVNGPSKAFSASDLVELRL